MPLYLPIWVDLTYGKSAVASAYLCVLPAIDQLPQQDPVRLEGKFSVKESIRI
jgi:hypothetical protein